MAIRPMVHTFVALMIVLTFSMPSTISAQQKPQTEISETVAAQDANAIVLEAKAAAEQDVSNDINKLAWFGAGLGIAYVGGGGGAIAGCAIGTGLSLDIDPSYLNGCLVPPPPGIVGFLVGATLGVIVPINAIYNSPISVPAGRLTGKSPEYVEFYTNAYQRRMRSLKTKWAALGAATGYVPIIGCLVALLNSSSGEDD